MNLINFKYPMFATTEYEKEILRECELWYATHSSSFIGLCNILVHIRIRSKFNANSLRQKIPLNNEYLEGNHLKFVASGKHTLEDMFRIRNLMRRIWITKLLNYKE